MSRGNNGTLARNPKARILKDAPVDRGLDRLSFLLDQAIRIPGTDLRFGLDPIISFLFPVAGDSLSALMSVYIILMSVRHGLPKVVISRMIFNVGVDYLIGSVPLIGDLFDFAWKANRKNMDLLNRHATGEKRSTWGDWIWVFALISLLVLMIIGILTLIYFAFKTVGTSLFERV